MQQRGAIITRRAPGAFRCLVCRVYVQGTEAGHCPRCGFVPPSAPPVTDRAASPRIPPAALRVLWVVVAIVAAWRLLVAP